MKKMQQGFTLIELLVVISIIGILAAMILVNMVGIRERAADTKSKNDLNQLKSALRLYYNDNQSYPPDTNGDPCRNPGGTAAGAIPLDPYMKNLLGTFNDPATCRYKRTNIDDGFIACVALKNSAGTEDDTSRTTCGFDASMAGLMGADLIGVADINHWYCTCGQ